MLGKLPSVSELLESPPLKKLADRASRNVVVERARTFLDDLRTELQTRASEISVPSVRDLAERIAARLLKDRQVPPRPVVNATGTIWPPGLGGPPLAVEAIDAMAIVGGEYTDVHSTLDHGRLVSREADAVAPLARITGADAALVVGSYPSAVVLTLAALASGREVIVLRGQNVEQSDGFRLQEAISLAGARLCEVGASNVTRPADVRSALGPSTAAVLNVWPDAFRRTGPWAELSPDELAKIAHQGGVPVIEDLGASCLTPIPAGAALCEASAKDRIAAGADIVLLRGDGLLGGPMCGVILGRRELVERIAGHPLARVLGASAATSAGLAATLRLYAQPAQIADHIPVLQLLCTSAENLRNRAARLEPQLAACPAIAKVEVAQATTAPIPAVSLETWRLLLTPADESPQELAQRLWNGPTPLVGSIEGERLVIDPRTILPRQDQAVADAFTGLAPEKGESIVIPVRSSDAGGSSGPETA